MRPKCRIQSTILIGSAVALGLLLLAGSGTGGPIEARGAGAASSTHAGFISSSSCVPAQLNYQGYLLDKVSECGVNDTLTMHFRIFDLAQGGRELWNEAHESVVVTDGVFNVLLGSVSAIPDSVFDGSVRWLQTEIGPEVLSPRKEIVSVGYSFRSCKAESAAYAPSVPDSDWVLDGDDVYRVQGNVGIGTPSPAEKLDVSGAIRTTGFKLITAPSAGYVLTSDAHGAGIWGPPLGGMSTGTFVGDGNPTQAVTTIGFQPRFLVVYAQTLPTHKWMKSEHDVGSNCQVITTIEIVDDVIISLDSNGFTVGDFETMNNLGEVYVYIAFR